MDNKQNMSNVYYFQHYLRVVLLVSVLVGSSYSLVSTQMKENLSFAPNTPQVRMLTSLPEFESSSLYSIWGWFKFNGETPAISNIVSLRNLEQIVKSQQEQTGPFPDPNYPTCPVNPEDILFYPYLANDPDITNNPNCFPKNTGANTIDSQSIRTEDLLYINYDLNPPQGNEQKYSVIFLCQSGISESGKSDMMLEGFEDLPLTKNLWSFFAISADYATGDVSIFLTVYEGNHMVMKNKTFKINYPEFKLKKSSELILAGVELNPYFQSTSGFIGNIAVVEMGLFYSNGIDNIWSGFMGQEAFNYNGVIKELLFHIYNGQNSVDSKGLISGIEYQINGTFVPVNSQDRRRVGVALQQSSSIDLETIDFNNINDLIKSFVFYFHIKYQESLSDNITLLKRGNKDSNGFIRISLLKKNNGRVIQMVIKGAGETMEWQSDSVLKENEEYKIMVGFSISPAMSANVVYWDNTGSQNFDHLAYNIDFNSSPQKIMLMGDAEEDGKTGMIYFYRFMILNSASASYYKSLSIDSQIAHTETGLSQTETAVAAETDIAPKQRQFDKCDLHTSFYEGDRGCLICKESISNSDRKCVDYCPVKSINALSDTCLTCRESDCSDFETTVWTVTKQGDQIYRLTPSNRIKSEVNYNSLFTVVEKDTGKNIEFTQTVNPVTQEVDIELAPTEDIKETEIEFKLNQDEANPMFDENNNLIYAKSSTATIERICYVSDDKKEALQALAITVLGVYALSLILLIIFTICCFKKIHDIGGLWKFFLHNWMKLQMVAFFLLLGVYLPCCVKEFLNILYLIAVKWDHAFNDIINDSQDNNTKFNSGLLESQPPKRFTDEGVYAFILHNICVAFIVHLFILLMYIVVKIWDVLITSTAQCMYKTFIFMEFTVLIVGFLLVEMHIFVFSALNWRLAIFTTAYFVICFIIAILYILVFILFWLFAAFRLAGSQSYFADPINYNKFYYFFAGFRDNKWARTYDIWLVLGYMIIGFMIGLLLHSPLAQMIVILCVLVVLFLITIILRPWSSLFLFLVDIISQVLILAGVIVLLIIASYDASECFDCGDREGSLCWLIVMFFFLGLLLAALGLIAAVLFSVCMGDRFNEWGKNKKTVVIEENEVIEIEDNNNQRVEYNNNYHSSRYDNDVKNHSNYREYNNYNEETFNNYSNNYVSQYNNQERQYDEEKRNENYFVSANKFSKYNNTDNKLSADFEARESGLRENQLDYNPAEGMQNDHDYYNSNRMIEQSYRSGKEGNQIESNKFGYEGEERVKLDSNQKSMNEFLQEMKQERQKEETPNYSDYTGTSYYSEMNSNPDYQSRHVKSQNNSKVHGDSLGNRSSYTYTQMVRPDRIDEEYKQPNVAKALSNNMEDSYYENSRMELGQQKKIIDMRKDNFYKRSIDNYSNNDFRGMGSPDGSGFRDDGTGYSWDSKLDRSSMNKSVKRVEQQFSKSRKFDYDY